MANTELNDNQTRIRDSDINGLTIRGGLPFISWSQVQFRLLQCSLFIFPIPFSWEVSHII